DISSLFTSVPSTPCCSAVSLHDALPISVSDRLRAATAHLETFTVRPRLVVSPFADIGSVMARALVHFEHPVLDALSGHEEALARSEEHTTGLQPREKLVRRLLAEENPSQ